MKTIAAFICVLSIICLAFDAYAEEVTVATGQTFIKKVFAPIKGPFREKTGIEIRIFYNDPAPAIAALEKGNVELAGASLPFEDWLGRARKAGIAVSDISEYSTYIPVTEKTMVVAHVDNKINNLSKDQLRQIFTGKINNWRDVGGDDMPILVVWPSVSSGALLVFTDRVLNNEPIAKTVYDVETIADTAGAIAAAPEAIGITTGILSQSGIKEIASQLERPLTLVYKGKPSPNLQKLLDYIKEEGRQLIK